MEYTGPEKKNPRRRSLICFRDNQKYSDSSEFFGDTDSDSDFELKYLLEMDYEDY